MRIAFALFTVLSLNGIVTRKAPRSVPFKTTITMQSFVKRSESPAARNASVRLPIRGQSICETAEPALGPWTPNLARSAALKVQPREKI